MSVKAKIVIDTTEVAMVTDITEVHYRIIWSEKDQCGYVVCVQNFDYYDYKEFVGTDCFQNKSDAEDALHIMTRVGMNYFRTQPVEDDSDDDAKDDYGW